MKARLQKIFLFFLLSGNILFSRAQNFNPFYHFKQLNVQNGLAENIVYHFLQDSRGYMWAGTRNGLTLFDGSRTLNFQHEENNKNSIAGNIITRILEDSDHIVWIGTDAGIERFNQKDNSFSHFGVPDKEGKTKNTDCVLLGIRRQTDIWFIDVGSKELKIFNSKTKAFRTLMPTDAVEAMMFEEPTSGKVQIWTCLSISTTHHVFRGDSLLSTAQYFNGEEKSNLPPLLIFHVFPENDSTTWLATAKGLIELNPATHNYKVYNKLNNEPVTELRYIGRSPGGLFWTGTGNAGIFTFDPKTKRFADHFKNETLDPYSVCSNNIVSIYFDQVGNVWCGSYGAGLSYAHIENNFPSKHLSKTEMNRWKKDNNIAWLGPDAEGNIWCLVQDVQGFWKLDSNLQLKEFRQPLLENGEPFIAAVYQMLFDGKSIAWCTTDRGLFRYNPQTNRIKQVHYRQLSNTLFGSYWSIGLTRLQNGNILFTTFGGVYQISHRQGKEIIEPFPAFENLPVSFDIIFEDSAQRLYIKDSGDTLYICERNTLSGNYTIIDKRLFHPLIFQFQEMGAHIFMATNAGLFQLNKKDNSIQKSAVNKMLPFAAIKNVLIERNNFWLFGEKGLYQYSEDSKSGRLYSIEDGLPSNEFKEYSFMKSAKGKCYVGTKNGILSFDPLKTQDIVYPPRAQLINMYVNDSSTGFLASVQECSSVGLDHNQNTFSFDYSCISFQHAQAAAYEYKLEGLDENWIRGGTTHYTRYSGIAPGHYTFKLRAIDANGKVSPYGKNLAIYIRKAFWQTNLFRIAVIAVLACLIWMLIKWYLNIRIRQHQVEFEKQQAIEKERTRIATDMHDDLGAGLSRIKFLSDTIAMKKQQHQPIEEDIGSISNYANEMIGKMGEIVWALNEKNDSLSDLLSYTRAYATEYLMNNGIRCSVQAPDLFPLVFVSGEFRRNIYLTIKEALHNIVKHARAENVRFIIHIDKNLQIVIEDDGIGFSDRHIRPFSNGLNNMKKRMQDISGRLEIIQDKGTTIVLNVPLPA